jgi:TolA-binding protein
VQFEALLKQETSALRSTIARLMVRHLRFKAGDGAVKKALAPEEEKFIATYEATSDAQFEQLGANDYARATWIYYISGLRDLADSKTVAALAKFDAAAKSPDDYLAAEALLEAGLVHLKAGDLKAARDSFQHLLFSTHSVPGAVRATYYLAICHKKGGDDDSARRRLEEIVRKFPISPYAERARKDPLLQNAPKPAPPAEPKPSAS